MKPYSELNAMPAESFLNPSLFGWPTPCVEPTGYALEQYNKGLAIGQKSLSVHIACNSTWGGSGKNGGQTSSYEGIGYHAGTGWLLKGFLDSGVPIVVYRMAKGVPITETWIQGTKPTRLED
jgi:hypothetical protein